MLGGKLLKFRLIVRVVGFDYPSHISNEPRVYIYQTSFYFSLVLDSKLETVMCTLNPTDATRVAWIDSGLKAFLILLVGRLKFRKFDGHHIAYDIMPTNLIGHLMRWHVQCC